MSRILAPLALALALALATGPAVQAQVVDRISVNYSPRTGDVWLDTRLSDVNVFARGDTDGFIDDVVVSYGAPRPFVRELLFDRGWVPADVWYACLIAQQLRQPCSQVADAYQRDRGQGWGVVAQRLGIKPGSAEFHALKGRVGKGHERVKARGKPAHAGKPAQSGKPAASGKPPASGKPANPGKGKDKGKG